MKKKLFVKVVGKAIRNVYAKFETLWHKIAQATSFYFSGKHRPFLPNNGLLVKQYIRFFCKYFVNDTFFSIFHSIA